MNTVVERAKRLANFAVEKGVRLLVDAEQTYFQPAIRHIVVNVLMPKYNMDTPTIYNTIQCYLKVIT
jgi:proline dehydrogenase